MVCKKCGAEIRAKAKFCAKCGTPVPVVAPAEPAKPAAPAKHAAPAEEVKTLFTRDEPARPVIHVPPTETAAEKKEEPRLIVTMGETKATSSNGQFDLWFSEPGDL